MKWPSFATSAFVYDNMGRLIGTTTQYSFLPGHSFRNAYAYDAASNRTSLTPPDGSSNIYNYDTLNRLTTLTNSLTGQFGFGYDALSRRTQLTGPNGVNTNYNFDNIVEFCAGSETQDSQIGPIELGNVPSGSCEEIPSGRNIPQFLLLLRFVCEAGLARVLSAIIR